MRYGSFLFVLILSVTAPAFADEYHFAWEGWAPICVAVNKDPQTRHHLPRGIIAALQGTYITPVDGETDTAKALVYPRFTSGERDYAHPYKCDLVNVYPARNIKGVQVEVWAVPEAGSEYFKWELTRAVVTPTPPDYHDPVTPGGTPVGGALPSCTTELNAAQQNTIIYVHGCMKKSFLNEEGGLCAFGETSRDAYVYFSGYETNYLGQNCRAQFNGQYAVTVCPSGHFYLGVVSTATCLQGGI